MNSLFISTLLVLVAIICLLVFSIKVPEHRVWPPPQSRTWQYFLGWALTLLAFGLIFSLGISDWNSLGWLSEWRWTVGMILIASGNILAWVGVRQLGLKSTSGAKGRLITEGLYAYTRHPQYVGDICTLIGWAVLSASGSAIVGVLLAIVAFVLAIFAEEAWLEKIHGSAYRRFKEKTPRFLIV